MNIHVPAPELQSDSVAITGLAAHLDRAKAGLLERVKELQAEQEDRVSAGHRVASMGRPAGGPPRCHPRARGLASWGQQVGLGLYLLCLARTSACPSFSGLRACSTPGP